MSMLIAILVALIGIHLETTAKREIDQANQNIVISKERGTSEKAVDVLETIEIKGRSPKTDYRRAAFGDGWHISGECSTRDLILARDLENTTIEKCKVLRGTLNDPYTGQIVQFLRGPETSDDIQIDHMVALSDARQKGAQALSFTEREAFANDPLNLLAVDGQTNQDKSGSDAASWLPPNKEYHCRYIARQIAVKKKYALWMTQAEHDAMKSQLTTCPMQPLPTVQ